ncbi:MAG: hypothetical protein ACKVS9_00075 [Phycisphaerae bacterium]
MNLFPRLWQCPKDQFYQGPLDQVTVTLPRELREAAERLAATGKVTVNEPLAAAVEEFLIAQGFWGSPADQEVVNQRYRERKAAWQSREQGQP